MNSGKHGSDTRIKLVPKLGDGRLQGQAPEISIRGLSRSPKWRYTERKQHRDGQKGVGAARRTDPTGRGTADVWSGAGVDREGCLPLKLHDAEHGIQWRPVIILGHIPDTCQTDLDMVRTMVNADTLARLLRLVDLSEMCVMGFGKALRCKNQKS